jgi:hypothetical protein
MEASNRFIENYLKDIPIVSGAFIFDKGNISL